MKARRENKASQVGPGQNDAADLPGTEIMGGGQVGLGLCGHRIGGMDRAAGDEAGQKLDDSTSRRYPDTAVNRGGACIGHGRSGEDRESIGGSKIDDHRRLPVRRKRAGTYWI
jgi:hypothetical protein